MSFVLVLAAAVTLVVGLLQSGLTLIYLSIGCSVLAGVVLAVAVLRGRPEPRPAAAGRAFTPPAREPASVGAPSSAATTGYTAPSYPSAQETASPPPPPPSPAPAPAGGEDLATKAAGSALLGRLRRRGGQEAEPEPEVAEPEPFAASEPDDAPAPVTAEYEAVTDYAESEDGFPIADYDRMRAIELLAQLPNLDRNQLEAVRQREAAGKNRFTIMNRIDALIASKGEPAWEVDEDDWEDEEGPTTVIATGPAGIDEDVDEFDDLDEFDAAGEVEGDEVDELVSPAETFPIAGYESLTVGQILPRLSDLDADELAQVRAREQQGRARGTILDRVDRLAAKAGTGAGAMAMPPPAPARRAPARKAPAAKVAPAAKKARASRKAAAVMAPPGPAPAPAPVKAARKARASKAASAIPMPAPETTPVKAARKTPARKAAAAPVKKARATKAAAKKATKRL